MNEQIRELIAVLEKNIRLMDRLHDSLDAVYTDELLKIGKTDRSALMVVGFMENWYTCLETALFRISQQFENHLQEHQWHRDLLEKMTLDIDGVRLAAVSEANFPRLLEILKFRHFKRYYFEMDFDWDRLEFLRKKLDEAHPAAIADLRRFVGFLREIVEG
jgi:hypothetical protein